MAARMTRDTILFPFVSVRLTQRFKRINEKIINTVLNFQFNVKKTAEPVQPRALLKFPNIYGPKPVVTSPEVVNYTQYSLKTTEEPATVKHAVLDENRMKIQVNEELFILPQNGRNIWSSDYQTKDFFSGCRSSILLNIM